MGWIIRALLMLVGLVVVLGASAYFVLKRPDIPYETLATRYESAASRYVDLPSGVRVHYRDEGQSAGPTLVLLHGFSSSLHTWESWVERLGEDYRVISLDLPGHGLTRAPDGYAPSIEALRDVVSEFAQQQQLTRVAIAGNSMGGHVAWEYALAHPEQIEALILVDSAGWPETGDEGREEPLIFRLIRNPAIGPIIRDLDNSRFIRSGLQASFADAALADDAMVTRYIDLSRAPGHRAILLSLASGARPLATPERLAPLANMPVLILHGDADALIPIADGERFRDAISGAEFVAYEGVGHLPQEETPDASAQTVHEFLYRVHEGPVLAAPAQ